MVECACHLAGGFGVSGHFQRQSEFEVHLGYMRCNLKKMRGGEEGRGREERDSSLTLSRDHRIVGRQALFKHLSLAPPPHTSSCGSKQVEAAVSFTAQPWV